MTTISDLDLLDFVGEPFDMSPTVGASVPTDQSPITSVPLAIGASTAPVTGQQALAELRAGLVAAHTSALRAQEGLLRWAEPADERATPPTRAAVDSTAADHDPVEPMPTHWDVVMVAPGTPVDDIPAIPPSSVREFKPLARSNRTALFAAELAQLAAGDIDAVFGSADDRSYDQHGVNPAIALSTPADGGLVSVTDLDCAGGRCRRGQLTGRCATSAGSVSNPPLGFIESSWQAAQVLAMRFGLHLCIAEARFEAGGNLRIALSDPLPSGEYDLVVEVQRSDLAPRPQLTVRAALTREGRIVAELAGLTLTLRESTSAPIGPGPGGLFTGQPARRTSQGEPVLLNEFHMAHASNGDLGITMGPEFHQFLGRRATRMPDGGLRLCDRILTLTGTRGELQTGAAVSEYDSPENAWYYREYLSQTMPNAILMETSLQSALMMGYFLGPTLVDEESDYSLRNLDGRATVLREVDLRGVTIRQRSQLVETTVLAESILQKFRYELSVDGAPFYRGESLFGYFTAAAMAGQTGLDGGRSVPTWLDENRESPTRTIDIVGRPQGLGGPGPARAHLCLISGMEVVDSGGHFGLGYLRAVQPIRDTDWYFGLHFHLDPVMPGSLGIEAVVQALQEWAIDAGLLAGLTDPEFVLPVDLEFTWAYRGQILASDREMTLEAHIKRVDHEPGRIRVVADASVFKPGLRIYGMTDLAVEARDKTTNQ